MPTETLLRKELGSLVDYYLNILSVSGHFRKQWQYSRGNGWILKVDDMHKALYYLIPFEGGIEISLTIRDGERTELLKSNAIESLHSQIESAQKYSEGYALRFEIENFSGLSDGDGFSRDTHQDAVTVDGAGAGLVAQQVNQRCSSKYAVGVGKPCVPGGNQYVLS